MARLELRPKDGRLLAVVLLLIVVFGIYLFGVHWWFVSPHIDYFNQMSDLREQQQRYARVIAERPAIEKRLAEVSSYEQGNQAFLAEADANAASANLISRLRQSQTDQSDPKRCSIINSSPSNQGQEELYMKVVVQARLRCDLESLAAILYDLENGKPYLFVDDLMIYKQQTYVPPGGKRRASPLDVRFNLSGYLRQPGKPAETP
ncbi:MAG TPA: type II secretion system protein GspM [Dokdonella sp.]|uniref:type II secretion system protein GspM n=1 Tax=Dokdonella sp. TaxID=2291710 RepID=UPI002D7E20E1|nr:type II secretion system protein GspM [Dokdonella sp.]HET9032426.1 type II secretion system protein GspM [Dokdonella sp.]